MKKIIILLLLFSPCIALSQKFNSKKLDSLLDRITEADKAMLSLAIYEDGKPIYTRAIGYADVESKIEANPKTMYRIGSITKSFTATLILKLVEQEKLSLDTKLAKYYPELPNAEKITIKHLLNHHSGLFNFTNDKNYTSWMQQPKSKAELIKIIKINGTEFEPNEKGEYSNTNYVILTWIAEDASNSSFSDLLEKHIIEPLGLKRTKYQGKINTSNNEAYSYQIGNTWIKATETAMSIPLGAGAIVSTPSDLNLFYTALFNGEILNTASLEKMKTIEDNYGLGLFKFPFYEKSSFGHTGGIDSFSSMAGFIEEDQLAVSVTSNGSSISLNDVVLGALSIYYNKDYKLPTYRKSIDVDLATLKQYEGTYGSDEFPLDIKIFIEDEVLKAQATGQPSFVLTAVTENTFEFSAASLEIVFSTEDNNMKITESGNSYTLEKK
ncbi:serine hydrolase domain-containing protein [Mesonia aestuariivivens]|uniref:Beta-lactamase family protein n=1 Tax=Mesonia aestuariivivens TaxID=2796128 RepID=A0ABS6W0F6_9FLAO|nr:serine hydrolase domain-containing protein [Mesonia aestuariivivens]MBW2961001.1 beta-lactamase family protein [Mesonia aestuariivivens]